MNAKLAPLDPDLAREPDAKRDRAEQFIRKRLAEVGHPPHRAILNRALRLVEIEKSRG